MRRRRRFLAAVAIAAAALAAGGAAGSPGAVTGAAGPAPGEGFRLRTGPLGAGGARALADAAWRGGAYSTSGGDLVTVYVSTAYADSDAVGLRWANFFASLEHGPELAQLAAYVAPLEEVRTLCESQDVLGCYGGGRLIMPGELPGSILGPESVAAHEYGHHVASNRANPPWSAVAWGTKRWASREDVCRRAASGTAYPGNEGAFYGLNPGEAFAETYRVVNELRVGATTFAWPIVDPSFRPDRAALDAAEQDVLRPYTPPPAATLTRRFARRQRTWRLALATPLDGNLRATLRLPLGAGHELTLLDDRGRVAARGLWSGPGRRSISYTVCGARKLTLRVDRRGPSTRFTVTVSRP
jgi:hypothetical protein